MSTSLPPSTSPRTWTKSADRPLRSRSHSLGIWIFAHVLGVPVPWRAVRQTDARALLAFEHGRLQALAAAGEHVPPVLAFDGFSLTTGDIGETVDYQLYCMPEGERLPLMCAASADLAAFHARGQWHGGAQLRNTTWDGQRFARLDFEEQLRPGMALSTVQVYDVLQMLFSLARFLQPLGPSAVLAVLQAYDAAGPGGPALRGFIAHLLPRLQRVARVAAWSKRLDRSREVMRLRTVLEGMAAFVAQRA
ncbi:hypothetical protein [Hydrogenophaga sp. BPS33]|uniref:hypothetical protein n=1 Tax=Hydrogenophaga sp. BPS33 TaxID=2651974 RepID=UPI00131F70F9|nr:hypothetical protein [Hydrogenophaga sp. BPS33]QHE83575.1 hypothetical protein F9K07_01120 [Hydrogenophaga sp. BPS33]